MTDMTQAAAEVAHAARMAQHAIESAAWYHSQPSAVFRPALSLDGDQWCALYGANLQEGVCGFGSSPALAMAEFDKAWSTATTPKA